MKIKRGISNYFKNVAGGAKIVGGAIKNLPKSIAGQIEKEWRGEDAQIEDFRYKRNRKDLGL